MDPSFLVHNIYEPQGVVRLSRKNTSLAFR